MKAYVEAHMPEWSRTQENLGLNPIMGNCY